MAFVYSFSCVYFIFKAIIKNKHTNLNYLLVKYIVCCYSVHIIKF